MSCILELPNVHVCEASALLKLPQKATIEGDYTLVLIFEGQALHFSETFAAGEDLAFKLQDINESYCYRGYALDPSFLIFPIDGFSEFSFCTRPIKYCSKPIE